MSIDYYRHLELPSDGPAAATWCLQADPPRPPGSSCEFRAAAGRLSRTAQALRVALSRLEAIRCDQSIWDSDAGKRFKELLHDPKRIHLDKVPDRYDGYARNLVAYASTLDDHQASIDAARAQVQSALDEYKKAVATRLRLTEPAGTFPPHPPVVGPVVDPIALENAAIQACADAASRFQAVYNAWIDSALQCQRGIKKVDADPLHNPHGASAAGDALYRAVKDLADWTAALAGEINGLASVLALVSIVLFPEAAPILFEIATMASMAKSGADIVRKTAFHENVSGWTLASDALGAIPVGRTSSAARLAAKSGKGVRGAAKVFAKTFGFDTRSGWGEAKAAAAKLRRDGGLGESISHTSVRRTGNVLKENWKGNKQDLFAYPGEWLLNAGENRKKGWGQAIGWSAFRVTWKPVGTLVPEPVAPLQEPPRILSRIGQP